jgi:hypothetical protein
MKIKFWLPNICIPAFLLYSPNLFALECDGYITEVRSSASECSGHYSYKISSNDDYWICSDSDFVDSVILSTYLSQKTVLATLPGSGSCQTGLTQDFIVQYSLNLK